MADETPTSNSISAGTGRVGDVPESLRRRYLLDEKGGYGLGFYADAQVKVAAFRDQGRVLATGRADPTAIRDMTAIAKHRGWAIVVARGSAQFRRQAWMEGRAAGLEVRGYRPTERDMQELARRHARERLRPAHPRETVVNRSQSRSDSGADARLAIVDSVVRARVSNPRAQERIMAAARLRVATWLERGAQFDPLRVLVRAKETEARLRRERQR